MIEIGDVVKIKGETKIYKVSDNTKTYLGEIAYTLMKKNGKTILPKFREDELEKIFE